MSTNGDLARLFNEMASVLELTGANPFRAIAHAKVARVLRDLTVDVATLADEPARLIEIDGIGEGSAKKIIEFVTTGRIREHDELVAKVPRGLFEVMEIPGLGPKTVKTLWEQAGVTDLATLNAAIESGRLAELPRMGEKTIENIKRSIAFATTAKGEGGGRVRLGKALPIAEMLVQALKKVKGVKQVVYAGSLRRGRDTIGDVDLLASTTSRGPLVDAFCTLPEVSEVLAAGETKCSVRLSVGMQVDLRIVEADAFGAALLYFTGSKDHNIVLRDMAIKRKMRLNEYGLFKDEDRAKEEGPPQKRGVKPVAAKTEEDIYAALDLAWIPPELREDRGEIDAARSGTLPTLIEIGDIKAELHAHTIASDGRFTIEELARHAKARGYHTIAVTDHSQSQVVANGLSPDRLRAHIDAVREANRSIKGITILAGSEVDILADGRLDYEDDLLAALDIVIASPHGSLRQEPEKATKRMLAAIRHPLVHIIGHPTGRKVLKREGLSPDLPRLIEAAVEHNTALEINANSIRLDLRDTHVRAAVEAGATIAVNTDAHSPNDFDELRFGILTARRGWLSAGQCLNTWTKSRLHAWLKKKR